MKLLVFCVFAVWCSFSDSTSANQADRTLHKRKLEEVLRQLDNMRGSLQENELMELHTPPRNIEDCCCQSALECFRANLLVNFNVTKKQNKRLYNSLKSQITEKGLCISSPAGNTQSTCQDCDSHPKENAREFFTRLENLIQKAITRLSMRPQEIFL